MGDIHCMENNLKKSNIKYEIGYQLSDRYFSFTQMASEFIDHIDTVYFPWIEMATCRNSISNVKGNINWMAQFSLERDLRWLREHNIKLNLLFNANCYGEQAVSKYLENEIRSIIEHLDEIGICPDIVTTASPAIAQMVKRIKSEILTRTSVNMKVGTVEGMKYISDFFDEYNMQRDYNRDFERIRLLKTWADENGKGLYMLANSGCLRNCSAQIFHDNLVAHDLQIAEHDNIDNWYQPNCRRLMHKRENWEMILESTWVRPEDIHNYQELFPVIKLATRQHENPRMVIRAYADEKYYGSVADLLEPGFSKELAPYVITNQMFPDDWFERTSKCSKVCERCGYCKKVLDDVIIDSSTFTQGNI